ncbi:MAG TPA: hypothetical protein VMB47_13750 [Candidatus Aquilonibacter sp.]|nr:hypothetical protein [Candidatus Aquilonibacter sp.]
MIAADQQPGADGCARVNASWSALPATGGVVDARWITATQPCASDPFEEVAKTGETLLGGATFQTSATWVLGDKSIVQGIGRGDSGSTNTVIQAAPNLSGPVLQLASNNSAFEGVRAKDLTIDCNANQAATGVLNNVAQEESGLRHVLIVGCTKIGLDIEDGSQNSSYDDIEVLSAGSSNSARPVVVNTRGPLRGVHGLTVNTWSEPYPNIAMQIRSMGSYTDMHCEGAFTCFYVDANNVTLVNIECGPNVSTCVLIAPGVRNLTIMGLYSSVSGGVMIENEAVSPAQVLTGATDGYGVGWYAVGDGTPTGVCSSSTYVTCTFRMPAPPPQSLPIQDPIGPRRPTSPRLAVPERQ